MQPRHFNRTNVGNPLQLRVVQGTLASSSRLRSSIIAKCQAPKRDLYEILELDQKASAQEIKRAYKKKALKLHPDVNKEPDAQHKFLEAKYAYETLIDEKSRRIYDMKRQGANAGFGGGDFDFGGFGGFASGSRGGSGVPEYTWDEFLADVGKEFNEWLKDYNNRQKSGGTPPTLADEIAFIGGAIANEFLDFLEESLGLKEQPGGTGQSGSSTTTTSNGSTSSSQSTYRSSGYGSKPSAQAPMKSPKQQLDDELEEMKKRLGLE